MVFIFIDLFSYECFLREDEYLVILIITLSNLATAAQDTMGRMGRTAIKKKFVDFFLPLKTSLNHSKTLGKKYKMF